MHLRRDAKHPHRFLEKCRLLALRLGKRHLNLRPAQRDRNPGKPSARAKIQQRCDPLRQRPRTSNRLHKMPRENPFLIPNRGQIDPCIPANQERKIFFESARLLSVQRYPSLPPQERIQPQPCAPVSPSLIQSEHRLFNRPAPSTHGPPSQSSQTARATPHSARTFVPGATARRQQSGPPHPAPPLQSRRLQATPHSPAACRPATRTAW